MTQLKISYVSVFVYQQHNKFCDSVKQQNKIKSHICGRKNNFTTSLMIEFSWRQECLLSREMLILWFRFSKIETKISVSN